MSPDDVKALLDHVDDTQELVLPAHARPERSLDELYAVWCAARAEANIAYDGWCRRPDADSYAVYRAAEDRADAAQQALAEAQLGRRRPLVVPL